MNIRRCVFIALSGVALSSCGSSFVSSTNDNSNIVNTQNNHAQAAHLDSIEKARIPVVNSSPEDLKTSNSNNAQPVKRTTSN